MTRITDHTYISELINATLKELRLIEVMTIKLKFHKVKSKQKPCKLNIMHQLSRPLNTFLAIPYHQLPCINTYQCVSF